MIATGLTVAGTAVAKPHVVQYHDKYADVDSSWSAEAAAVPLLVRSFKADFAKEKARSIDCGKTESEVRLKSSGMEIKCQSSTKVTTSGRTARLLSLARTYWAFTGGAHGNGATTGLLWDRRLGKELRFPALFSSSAAAFRILRVRYCQALDKERRRRRGGNGKLGSLPEFDSCPDFSVLSIVPADSDHDQRFDKIHLIAAAYNAGPYSEGEYDIAVAVSAQLVRVLKSEYRSSFEAHSQ